MPRLMSVAFTEQAVVERRKTVTRRKGWLFLKPGDRLTLCRKVQGRKPGEPLVRLAEIEVVDVRREPLADFVLEGELTKEGFPEWDDPSDSWGHLEFLERYFTPQGIDPADDVTRIKWRYLDEDEPAIVSCDTCGDAYAGQDPEDAGLHLCAGSVAWDPGPWHCDECLRRGDCGPCKDESAREWQAEVRADGRWGA